MILGVTVRGRFGLNCPSLHQSAHLRLKAFSKTTLDTLHLDSDETGYVLCKEVFIFFLRLFFNENFNSDTCFQPTNLLVFPYSGREWQNIIASSTLSLSDSATMIFNLSEVNLSRSTQCLITHQSKSY